MTPSEDIKTTTTYERAPDRAEFYGYVRGTNVFSFNKAGAIISRKLVWPEEPESVRVRSRQFVLPFRVDGLVDAPLLPVGQIVVSGATAGGKSAFVRALERSMGGRRLIAVEPHDNGEEVAGVPTYSSADSALAAAVAAHYADGSRLHFIDSLRAPLFETPGAAGEKGMSMPFFTQITRVSNCLALNGITIVATVNPMNNDSSYVDSFLDKLAASVPATFLLTGYRRAGKQETFTGTYQSRPLRKQMPFSWTVGVSDKASFAETVEISYSAVGAQQVTIMNDTRATVRAIKEAI